MINLDEFEEGKMIIAGEEVIKGHYHKTKNVFYPLEEFVDVLIADHKDCSNKIDGLSTQNDELKKEIDRLEKQLDKELKRGLNATQDIFNDGRKNGIKEVCNIIYDRQHFYMNESATTDLYLQYSDIVDQLKQRNLWIL